MIPDVVISKPNWDVAKWAAKEKYGPSYCDTKETFYDSLVLHRTSDGKYKVSSSTPFHRARFVYFDQGGRRMKQWKTKYRSVPPNKSWTEVLEDGDTFVFSSVRRGWTGFKNGGG